MWPTSATPSTTARANKRIQHEGLGCVLTPAPMRWKLTRRRATEAELKEIVDNGSFTLSAGQQESQMDASFCPLLATGVTLDDMFGSSSRSKRVSRTTPPPAPVSSSALEEAVAALWGNLDWPWLGSQSDSWLFCKAELTRASLRRARRASGAPGEPPVRQATETTLGRPFAAGAAHPRRPGGEFLRCGIEEPQSRSRSLQWHWWHHGTDESNRWGSTTKFCQRRAQTRGR